MVAFYLIVAIVLVAIFFLISFLYKPVGRLIYRIGKDAFDTMRDRDDAVGKSDDRDESPKN